MNKVELIGVVSKLAHFASCETNLLENDGRNLSQKDISEILDSQRKKTTNIMNVLDDLKIIHKKNSPSDIRNNLFYIDPNIFFQGNFYIYKLCSKFGIKGGSDIVLQIKENDIKSKLIEKIYTKDERYVYFIYNESDNEIKIGVSSNIEKRLKTLEGQIGRRLRILKYIEGNEKQEKELHDKFAHLRLHGEWFKPSSELKEYINNL